MQIPEDLRLIPSDSWRLCKRDDDWNQFLILLNDKRVQIVSKFPIEHSCNLIQQKTRKFVHKTKWTAKRNKQKHFAAARSRVWLGVASIFVVKSAVVGFIADKSRIYDLQVIKWVNWSDGTDKFTTSSPFRGCCWDYLTNSHILAINSSPLQPIRVSSELWNRFDANEVVKCDHENTSLAHKIHDLRDDVCWLSIGFFGFAGRWQVWRWL